MPSMGVPFSLVTIHTLLHKPSYKAVPFLKSNIVTAVGHFSIKTFGLSLYQPRRSAKTNRSL